MIRNSVWYFCALALFAVAGFWPSYFVRFTAEREPHVHLHGFLMFLWVVLLVSQAWLVRTGHRPLHRLVGKVSYALVPMIVLATLSLAHFRVREAGAVIPVDLLYFFYVQLALVVLFALMYALAIHHRKSVQLHARYMVGTALTLVDPILARLLHNHLDMDFPPTQFVTYGLVDLVLLALWMRDRRASPSLTAAPAMLLLFLVFEAPTFYLYRLPGWESFARWYGSLPIP